MQIIWLAASTKYLQDIFRAIIEILHINDLETYRAKLSELKIHILVEKLEDLPKKILLLYLDGKDEIAYDIKYSGYSNQCSRCKYFIHLMKNYTTLGVR